MALILGLRFKLPSRYVMFHKTNGFAVPFGGIGKARSVFASLLQCKKHFTSCSGGWSLFSKRDPSSYATHHGAFGIVKYFLRPKRVLRRLVVPSTTLKLAATGKELCMQVLHTYFFGKFGVMFPSSMGTA